MAPYWIPQVNAAASLSLLGAVLTAIPLFWLLQARNIGCVLCIFWIGGLCLANGINMLLWKENTINFAPVWCDIYIRFYIASGIGTVSSSLVIMRRLYHIVNLTGDATDSSQAQKRRNIITDLLIGLGIPLLAIALFWFYQGHRFDILEGIGCVEAYPNTFLSILLNTIWPVPIGLVSAGYAVLAIRGQLARGRATTRDPRRLQGVQTCGLMSYYRLMVLAAASVPLTIFLSIYPVVIDLREGLYPYRGLADLHSGFGRVDRVAAAVWRQSAATVTVVNFRIWTPVPCAVFFFLIFGFVAEARVRYTRVLVWAAEPFRGAWRLWKRLGAFASGWDVPRIPLRPQRPVVDSGFWDTQSGMTTQDGWAATEPALPGVAFLGIGEQPLESDVSGTRISSTYRRVERGATTGDIVVMSPTMEPPSAYAGSSKPSVWLP